MEPGRDSQILVLQPFADLAHVSSGNTSRIRGLITEIIHESQVEDNEVQLSEEDSTTSSSSYIPWHISNKYYDADVTFRLSSVTLFGSATQSRPKYKARSARMVNSSEESASTTSPLDGDEELKRRVRNVFEALEKPRSTFKPKPEENLLEEGKRAELSKEIEGVDAVMMVVDSSQPLRQHQRLLAMLNSLNGEMSLLSGFDLAVSIVVALSSPLEEATSSSGQPPTMEQLSDLYTGEGWEFVDLDEHFSGSMSSSSTHEEDEEDGRIDDEESHGIPRIREALQTHTWPDLIRKNDRSTRMQSSANYTYEEESALDQGTSRDKENDMERALALLQIDLGSLDGAIEAEPTRQDEELAEAFLKKILASQASSLAQDEAVALPSRSLASMQAELEKFLESEDMQWPPIVHQPDASQDKEAWSTGEAATSSSAAAAFDDDFSDFVRGSEVTVTEKGMSSPLLSDAFDMELDLDDIALIEALEREQSGFTAPRNGISFESTLSAVMAQAERVRSINDCQKRREEAARIALTLTGEQP